ncbi:MAG: hypothetical protein MJK14_21515, partial [Rivularia sp. ALOHA_DT_140]|nr:hypothetical protein [Rivularia sp. ALOHA_DT_140]
FANRAQNTKFGVGNVVVVSFPNGIRKSRKCHFPHYKIDGFADGDFPDVSTHSRVGDWEVVKVEEYKSTNQDDADFESIVICYCKYSPISTSLEPLPPVNASHQLQQVK